MTAHTTIILSGAALAASFLGGCDQRSAPAARTETSSTTAAVPSTVPGRSAVPGSAGTGTDPKSPMDQSETSAAIKITADIRRAVMGDSAMSVSAQNCKIITDAQGVVTLRGEVKSQAEKDSVGAKAMAVAGVTKVENQLEISAD